MKNLLLIAFVIVSVQSYRVAITRVQNDSDNCIVKNQLHGYLEIWQDPGICKSNICLNDKYGYYFETYSCPNLPGRIFNWPCSLLKGPAGSLWPTCCKRLYCT